MAAAEPATAALVSLDASGQPSYSFYLEGTADWQWRAGELPANEERAAVHTGSLAVGRDPGASVIADWAAGQRAAGALLSLDPNVRPALVLGEPGYRERLERLVGLATLVKVSEEDLAALAPGAEPLGLAAAWAEAGPELVVVTHGAGGASALRAGEAPLHLAAEPTSVVDTVGAGDAFTAGLLAELHELGALRPGGLRELEPARLGQALAFAGRVAALTCARAGADPPRRAELADAPA